MTPTLEQKLQALAERHEEVSRLLALPEVLNHAGQFRELSREYAQLDPLVSTLQQRREAESQRADSAAMLDDPELGPIAAEDLRQLDHELQQLDARLQLLLLPQDPRDQANLFLEIRAGAGGDEAAIFAGDLFRMYSRYAESCGWSVEVLSDHPGEHGGHKEIVARLEGREAFSRLKFESGVHCVKRVPATESQGRVHTSTATVAVLPELDAISPIEIAAADIRVDTFRASGAGGQHVNKTDSAIRITHLPSGLVVECQDERSQHKNRARAMSLLQARLLDEAQQKQQAAQAESRRLQVGCADRSQRIRTYRYKDNLITDHRIDLNLHRLPEIMQGSLDELIDGLTREYQADQLKSLAEA